MEEKLDKIIDTLEVIKLRLDKIEERIEKDCSKMSEHINFVENTYTLVRAPLNFLKNKVENVMGRNSKQELPQIKISEEINE
jgi:tetrahydromethanopterin S-methyltransferase subunit G